VNFRQSAVGSARATLSIAGDVASQWNITVGPAAPLANVTNVTLPWAPMLAGAVVAVGFQLRDQWGNSVPYHDSLDFNGTELIGPAVISSAAGEFR
jgi:hypothetical protein